MCLSKKIAGVLLAAGLFVWAAAQAPGAAIRVNSVGFVPNYPKKASILVPEGDARERVTFQIKNAATHAVALEGETTVSKKANETNEHLWTADFTSFKTAGEYYVEVPGIGRSAAFKIADDAYLELYRLMMQGMYLWRCGNPGGVNAIWKGETYSHGQCHISYDGIIYTSGQKKDGTGGWHDAGDYNKYVVNSGITVGMMLKAWEHFRPVIEKTELWQVSKEGNIPQFLKEVKWNLDWVAKMQFEDSTVSHKLTTFNFGQNKLPEDEGLQRYFTPYSTAATASFVAMLAQARRVYMEFDENFARGLGNLAIRSYTYLQNHPANVGMAGQGDIFLTGAYGTDDADDRLWAAAELWESTGQQRFLDDFEGRVEKMNSLITEYFDWNNVQNLALITYLLSERENKKPEIEEKIRNSVISTANGIVRNANNTSFGRIFTSYYWGSNGIVARNVYILYAAYKITNDPSYAYAAQDAMSYLLGRNYYGRSYVTGIGNKPPVYPHCRRSMAQSTPNKVVTWPGYLIGGPHNQKDDAPEKLRCSLNEPCWFDDPDDFWTNEIAINWNSAMIFALAGLLPGSGLRDERDAVTSISHQRTTRAERSAAGFGVKRSRVINVSRGGALDIPHGAKVYTLDGRLVAHRKAGAPMPRLKRNGVYILQVDNKRY